MKKVFLKYQEVISEEINNIGNIYNQGEKSVIDFKVLDEILIRINRVINSVLDLSTEFIGFNKLGVYKKRRDVFKLLEKNNVIGCEMKKSLENLCGLRDINMNNTNEINLNNINYIINDNLKDAKDLTAIIANNI